MRNKLLTLVLVLAACGVSYWGFYSMSRAPETVRKAMAEQDAMMWLKMEFKLSDGQFEKIKRLHDDYYVECSVHCAAIIDARDNQTEATEVTRLEAICENAMAAHFEKVAAIMAPDEGRRYLAVVLPRVASYDHHQAPSLQVSH